MHACVLTARLLCCCLPPSPPCCWQIYPSFFQAPSASEALLPDGLVFSKGALPIVTVAFCAPDQAALRCGVI